MKKEMREVEVVITHMNWKGYGVGEIDGRPVWVLNALPGEKVVAHVRRKKGYLVGTAHTIVTPSPARVEPKDSHFVSSSPWQIMTLSEEEKVKRSLLTHEWKKADIAFKEFEIAMPTEEQSWNYRNKVEFSFYGDSDDVTHLSFHMRGSSFGKIPVTECSLMHPLINSTSQAIVARLNSLGIKARQLKSLIVRASFSQNHTIACLYIKDESIVVNPSDFEDLISDECKGIRIVFSNPKSPASIVTSEICTLGLMKISETICGNELQYDFDGFFQVNPPLFSKAMHDISAELGKIEDISSKKLLDLYAGVGVIGLCLSNTAGSVTASELFEGSKKYADINAETNSISNFTFRVDAAEDSLDLIPTADIVVVDPPRAGLGEPVVNSLREHTPETIVYVSCNPQTQAKNVAELQDLYEISWMKAYNFYPHTPHVEMVMILRKK